jgi:hypothetical protein
MPETKKLLVAFDPAKPSAQSSDFLIPWMREDLHLFIGLKSGKEHPLGMVVFVGRSVSVNDLFAKLVDTGAKINSVDDTLTRLREYVSELGNLRIGNVVRIVPTQGSPGSIKLEVVSNTPSSAKA